jgi:hypothetical protein
MQDKEMANEPHDAEFLGKKKGRTPPEVDSS